VKNPAALHLMLVIFTCIGCGASERPPSVAKKTAADPGDVMGRLVTRSGPVQAQVASSAPTTTGTGGATTSIPTTPTPGTVDTAPKVTTKPPTMAPVPPSPPPAKPGVTAAAKGADTNEPPPADKSIAVQMAEAELDFEIAQDAFTAAGNECASLCKALASMKRATEHLCELTQGGSNNDQKRCTDAKAKLETAQAKVKATCGGC